MSSDVRFYGWLSLLHCPYWWCLDVISFIPTF